MYNFEHESACPPNKAILNYLWYDYFHDSKINAISFDHLRQTVIFTLECSRDIEAAWNAVNGNREEKQRHISEQIDRFTYTLTFSGVKYFHSERLIMVNDYLNGRFKDTALLRKLSSDSKKLLYHFRIQTDDGYIDVIFVDFKIRKKAGHVRYPEIDYKAQTLGSNWNHANSAADIEGDDFERFLAMQKLYKDSAPQLLELARRNLYFDEDCEDSCMYSAYVLGKIGEVSDIPALLSLYLNTEDYYLDNSVCRCNSILPKRNILDAIELIEYRHKVKVKYDEA